MNKKTFWSDLKSGKFASMVKESSSGKIVSSSEEIYNIMKPIYAEIDDVEAMYIFFMNAKNKIISIEKMFTGSIASSGIYPREIVKKALELKATCIALIHNHPSGETKPSEEDYAVTAKIFVACNSIDVCVHDHVIVGDGFYSMADHGYMLNVSEKTKKFYRSVLRE